MLALFPLTLIMALKFLTSGSSHTTGTVALIRSHHLIKNIQTINNFWCYFHPWPSVNYELQAAEEWVGVEGSRGGGVFYFFESRVSRKCKDMNV